MLGEYRDKQSNEPMMIWAAQMSSVWKTFLCGWIDAAPESVAAFPRRGFGSLCLVQSSGRNAQRIDIRHERG